MAEKNKKLTDMACRRAGAGYLGDGSGLYLQTTAAGAKSWIFRYQLNKRPREMGLGSFSTFSLAEARERARRQRQLLADGLDPIETRKEGRIAAILEQAKALTFDECAQRYIESHRSGWRNEKHAEQWASTLRTYASPMFGALPVQSVDTAMVMRALGDLWKTKTETASRVRGRVEVVLDWAKVRGYRDGENPARWRGHLDKLLPKRSKVKKVQHHPALPYAELPAFVHALQAQEGVAARALELLILTAARSGEVIGAKWQEFDLDGATWTVPAERMKAGRPHEVPLPLRALEILRVQREYSDREYVFPGRQPRAPLSNMAMLALLKRMERTDLTAHGFRSTFRDWVADRTNYSGEVAEMALAHVVSNRVEAAYRRGTMKEKRRQLLADWAAFCASAQA